MVSFISLIEGGGAGAVGLGMLAERRGRRGRRGRPARRPLGARRSAAARRVRLSHPGRRPRAPPPARPARRRRREELLYRCLERIRCALPRTARSVAARQPASRCPTPSTIGVRSVARDHGLEGGPARGHVLAAPAAAVEVLVPRATWKSSAASAFTSRSAATRSGERALSPYSGYDTITAEFRHAAPRVLEESRDDSAPKRGADEHHGPLCRRVDRRRLEFFDIARHRVGPRF